MKIAFIHPDLGIGGAERLVVDAAVGLLRKGHTVDIYTSHHDPTHCFAETRDGTLSVTVWGDFLPRSFRFFGSSSGGGYILFAMLRGWYLALRLLFVSKSYDVLFVDQLSASIPILKFTSAKILFYCHFPDKLLTKRESILKRLYRLPVDAFEEFSTKMADEIVVNSKFTASVFAKAFRFISKQPRTLYPGIHVESFHSTVISSDKLIQCLLTNKKHTLLSINRFERKKSIELSILALLQIRQRAPTKVFDQLRLVIAGGYDNRVSENVEYLNELDSLAQSNNLSTHILMPGNAQQANKDAQIVFLPSFNEMQRNYLLKEADCLMYTPSFEHFGIVPLEAMYLKLPVIASNTGGPTETIVHNITGYLCDATPESFASALLDLLVTKTQKERDAMGNAGHERVKTQFSLDAFVGCLEDILQNTVDGVSIEAFATFYVFTFVLTLMIPYIASVLMRIEL